MRSALFAIAVILLATAAWANPIIPPPVNGFYYSTDLGGDMLTGVFSESWAGTSPGHGQVGNTLNKLSSGGGAQWKFFCTSIAAPPVFLEDTRDGNGDGEVVWSTAYSPGRFWLSDNGPWAPMYAIPYEGDVEMLVVTTTYHYDDWALIEISAIINATGRFDYAGSVPGFTEQCMTYVSSSITFVGEGDAASKPEAYPNFMDSSCDPHPGPGGWGDVTDILMTIADCEWVRTQAVSWGEVKSKYAH